MQSVAPVIPFPQSTTVDTDEHATPFAFADSTADEAALMLSTAWREMGRSLSIIKREELFKAAGFPSFRAYLNHKIAQWKERHAAAPGYKYVVNLIIASEQLAAWEAAGLALTAESEYEVRQARKLVKEIGLANQATALVTIVRALLGGDVGKANVKTLIEVLQGVMDSGAVTLDTGAVVLIQEATMSEIAEKVKQSQVHRLAKWVLESELIEQLDLATNKQYIVQRSEDGFSGDFQFPKFIQPDQPTMYDALRVMLDALYTAYDPQYYQLEI